MKRALARCAETLEELGFTALEASVYALLVEKSPITAYQVAKQIQKPTANVYKAIESLQRKGAVLVDDGAARLCRACPPDELFRALEASFASRRQNAERAFARLTTSDDDDRVYQLHSSGQVYERVRTMLRRAERIVLLDVFPIPATELAADIVAASERVCVHVKVYAPMDLPGAVTTLGQDAEHLRARWPGQWLNVVADGEEHLLALLTRDGTGVHHAVYSASAYLSVLQYSGMAMEIRWTRLAAALAETNEIQKVREVLKADQASLLSSSDLPAVDRLLERLEKREDAAESPEGSGPPTAVQRSRTK